MQRIHHQQTDVLSKSNAFPAEGVLIGELAQLTGFNAKAIRYYESIGVLPDSPRSSNGYRRYSQADVNRLNLLRRLRLLGISLAEAKGLLTETLDAACREVQQDLLQLVNARLVALDQEMAELQRLRAELEGCKEQLSNHAVGKDESFTMCYDQLCPACSPPSVSTPISLSPIGQHLTKARSVERL